MRVEVATRPAAVSRFRRGKLGGSRTDRGVVPEHVVVILRLSSMAVFAETVETTSEPVVKYVDAGTRSFQMVWTENGHFQMFKNYSTSIQSISP